MLHVNFVLVYGTRCVSSGWVKALAEDYYNLKLLLQYWYSLKNLIEETLMSHNIFLVENMQLKFGRRLEHRNLLNKIIKEPSVHLTKDSSIIAYTSD